MFIQDHVADFPVQIICEVLGVSRSGYDGWAGRAESARAAEERVLAAEIRAAHEPAAVATAARGCTPNSTPGDDVSIGLETGPRIGVE